MGGRRRSLPISKSSKKKPPKPGRPSINDAPMKRVNVMLDQETSDKASEIGSGNLSAGIRIAVKKYKPES